MDSPKLNLRSSTIQISKNIPKFKIAQLKSLTLMDLFAFPVQPLILCSAC